MRPPIPPYSVQCEVDEWNRKFVVSVGPRWNRPIASVPFCVLSSFSTAVGRINRSFWYEISGHHRSPTDPAVCAPRRIWMTCVARPASHWVICSNRTAVSSRGAVGGSSPPMIARRWNTFSKRLPPPWKGTGGLITLLYRRREGNYVVAMVASTATDMTGSIYHERQVTR